jgi:hypothetical protein
MIQLRDYQEQISNKAKILLDEYKIAYLSMQMRTGKTLTALAAAWKYGAKDVLFMTKLKAIESIKKDYELLNPSYNLTVQNYEQSHNINGNFDLIILDEAHSLGQFPVIAKRTKDLKKICASLPIIYLSGTPTPESYSQIFHQLFVSSYSPFPAKSFYAWAKEFVNIKKKYFFNRAINDYKDANKKLIDDHIKHLFLSYTQDEAGFKAEVKEHILYVPMKELTYKAAYTLIKDRIILRRNGNEILADTEVKLMQKLHQIYSGSVLDEEGQMICFDDCKAAFIKKKFAGKKIAIYYKYRAEENLIKQHFENVTSSPEEFNNSNDKVFISQVQSGREGVNLSTADCIVMFNIDYSAVSYFQARERMQFKERQNNSEIYWIFSLGGIEEKIYKAVSNKKDYTLSYFRKDYSPLFENV